MRGNKTVIGHREKGMDREGSPRCGWQQFEIASSEASFDLGGS